MPSAHALLSPSSAERWLTCPASIRMSEKVPDSESSYAHEGTLAHTLAELKGKLAFGQITERTYRGRRKKWLASDPETLTDEVVAEMDIHTDAYVELIKERVAAIPDSMPMFEQRVKTGIDKCWGTSDCAIVSPTIIEAVDFKYGSGVPVSAVENPQLKLYGLGALREFGDMLGEVETVIVTVHQPRLDSTSSYEIDAADLLAWRDEVVAPTAKVALGPDAPFNPTESACRWCPAAGECRARVEKATAEDFGADPDLITNEEMAELLGRIPFIKAWCASVEDAALHKVYSEDQELPGWKVVMSGGQRKINDPLAAIQLMLDHGYDEADVMVRKPQTLGNLDKLVKADGVELGDLLGDLLGRTEGKPSLARDDDKRESINPNAEAKKEFG